MRTLLGGIAAIFAFAFLDVAPAAAEPIECPLNQARRTITTDLPSGWWTTPIVNSLTDTRVQNIGGEPALICVYGSAGSVQRNAPEGQTCRARTGGFDCSRRVVVRPREPRTHSTGQLSVPQTYTFDLDEGSVGASGAADLWFEAETATELYITPRNGARIAVGDRSNRGYSGCSTARYTSSRVALSAVPVGSWVCVRTNEGRFSQFRMNSISPRSPRTLSIGYNTWR